MFNLGLLCIVLAWTLQFVNLLAGHRELAWGFVMSYCVGLFLVVVDGYLLGDMQVANLNMLSLIVSACVLIMITRKNKQPPARRSR